MNASTCSAKTHWIGKGTADPPAANASGALSPKTVAVSRNDVPSSVARASSRPVTSRNTAVTPNAATCAARSRVRGPSRDQWSANAAANSTAARTTFSRATTISSRSPARVIALSATAPSLRLSGEEIGAYRAVEAAPVDLNMAVLDPHCARSVLREHHVDGARVEDGG